MERACLALRLFATLRSAGASSNQCRRIDNYCRCFSIREMILSLHFPYTANNVGTTVESQLIFTDMYARVVRANNGRYMVGSLGCEWNIDTYWFYSDWSANRIPSQCPHRPQRILHQCS